jgi:hypothetical protein
MDRTKEKVALRYYIYNFLRTSLDLDCDVQPKVLQPCGGLE